MTGKDQVSIPVDLDVEEALLGALLIRPDPLAEVAEVVRAGDFYSLAHARLYSAMIGVGEREQAAFFGGVHAAASQRRPGPVIEGDREVALTMLDCLARCEESRAAVVLAVRVAELALARRLMRAASIAHNDLGRGEPAVNVARRLQQAVGEVLVA